MKRILLSTVVAGTMCWGPSAFAQSANATANAPKYTNGTQQLSQDLSGNLRVITAGNAAAGGTNGSVGAAGAAGTVAQSVQGISGGVPVPVNGTVTASLGSQTGSTVTATNGTTSATAGVSSTVVAAATMVHGFVLQNTCGTAEWFSNSLAAGTALTAANSITLAAGASFTSPDWWPIGGALIVASATAVACTWAGAFK